MYRWYHRCVVRGGKSVVGGSAVRASAPFRRRAGLALIVCLLSCVTAPAAPAQHQPQPNPEVLWRAYPLEQTPSGGAAAPRAPAARPRAAESTSAPARDPAWALLAAAAATALAAGAAALRRMRRPSRPAPAAIVIPGPILPPANASAVRRNGATGNGRVCQVRWSREGGAFYAVTVDADGVEHWLGDVQRLDWPGPGPPEPTREAQAALRLLVRDLRGHGWQALSGKGLDFDERRWYARRFRRPTETE
jgi:hypothetical protein